MCCVVENYQEEDGVRVRSCRLQAIGIWPWYVTCVRMSNFQVQFGFPDIATCHTWLNEVPRALVPFLLGQDTC